MTAHLCNPLCLFVVVVVVVCINRLNTICSSRYKLKKGGGGVEASMINVTSRPSSYEVAVQ